MAAASGLVLLAVAVTVLHLTIVLGSAPLGRRMTSRLPGTVQVHGIYQDGRGILRRLLESCDLHHWHLTSLATDPPGVHQPRSIGVAMPGEVGIMMTLSGSRVLDAGRVLAEVEGVARIDELHDDSD